MLVAIHNLLVVTLPLFTLLIVSFLCFNVVFGFVFARAFIFVFPLHAPPKIQYDLTVVASDSLNEEETTVVVYVRDLNDLPPVFEESNYSAVMIEETVMVERPLLKVGKRVKLNSTVEAKSRGKGKLHVRTFQFNHGEG